MIKDGLVILETDRLFIRRFQKTDFRNFLNLHQSPIIMKYFDGGAKTMAQAKKRFSEVIEHQNRYGFSYYNIFLKSTGEYIGQAGLYYNYDMSINLCYAFLEQYHKKGYAVEAITEILRYGFNKLNFSTITAMSAPENYGSRHLLEKVGAKFERERVLFSGMHALCYTITKNSFEKALPLLKKYNYRKAVGAILMNNEGLTYLFQRTDFPDSWQPIEGGMNDGEDVLDAVYREIKEEIGIEKDKLELISQTKDLIKYNYIDNEIKYGCVGQEKKFFLFKFLGNNDEFLYKTTDEPQEFSNYQLVQKGEILKFVPKFKEGLYKAVIQEFNRFLR